MDEESIPSNDLPVPDAASQHLFGVPNLLTYFRILLVPALIVVFFIDTGASRWVSLAIFAAASLTDFFDGYLARALDLRSDIGKLLDPIADKLIVGTALVLLVADRTIADWSVIAAIVILGREISVSGLREFLAGAQVSVPVTRLAKWKTSVQMVAIGALLLGPAGDAALRVAFGDIGLVTYIGLLLLWIAALLTLFTGYDYFRAGIRHLLGGDT